jgi:hypothetical protein
MLGFIIGIVVGVLLLMTWSCCKVSSMCSSEEEARYAQMDNKTEESK